MPSGIYKHKPHTPEARAKMSKIRCDRKEKLGYLNSLETREKMSLSQKGKRASIETKNKMGESQKRRYNRLGRKTYKRYIHLTATKEYKQWRSDVFQRDNWTCQTCGERGVYLEAHHIKSWSEFPDLRFDIENGATLCLECHKLTDNYKNKKRLK